MKTFFDCMPCFVRQGLDVVRLVSDDPAVHERVLREVLSLVSRMDMDATPAAMGQKIHRIIKQLTGVEDPYLQAKKEFNAFALNLYPKYKDVVEGSDRPFETAVRLAIGGNIIDLGVKSSLKLSEAEAVIEETLTGAFDTSELEGFRASVAGAKDILYLADNAGEIVFDRFLIEQIGAEKVTVVVKGGPIINDATLEDARAAGLTELVEVIDNGDDAPGTILESCSEAFRERFDRADLVISKGQGNFETLSEVDKAIFFILRVKCPVIAEHLGCDTGSLILRRNRQTQFVYDKEN